MRDVFLHHPQPIVGTSGALLYVTDHVTVKVAPQKAPQKVRDRINAQAAWMIEQRCECLPKIYAKWNGGYAMETLQHIVPTNQAWLLEVIRSRLEYQVWGQPRTVAGTVLVGHHREYIDDLLMEWAPHLARKLHGWMTGIAKLNLSEVMTHGDPTIDNMMMRADGTYVLTDPIPASPRMPALLASDLGKMLQSAWGYEDIKAGRIPDFSFKECYDTVVSGFKDADQMAAKYFLAVHLLRLIPYQTPKPRGEFLMRLEVLVMKGLGI